MRRSLPRPLPLAGRQSQKQDCQDEAKDERGPDLHGTPPRRRWDTGKVGRQAGSVKARSQRCADTPAVDDVALSTPVRCTEPVDIHRRIQTGRERPREGSPAAGPCVRLASTVAMRAATARIRAVRLQVPSLRRERRNDSGRSAICASALKCVGLGRDLPRSHRQTVSGLMPRRRARVACVHPFSKRTALSAFLRSIGADMVASSVGSGTVSFSVTSLPKF